MCKCTLQISISTCLVKFMCESVCNLGLFFFQKSLHISLSACIVLYFTVYVCVVSIYVCGFLADALRRPSGQAVTARGGRLSVAVRRTVELRADGRRCRIGGRTLHVLILNETGAELRLCLGEVHRVRAAVDRVDLYSMHISLVIPSSRLNRFVFDTHLCQQHQIARRAGGKRDRNHQHKQADNDAGRRAVELRNRRDEAAIAGAVDADRLHDQHDHLEKEHEEEHHEVEAGVGAERLVGRSVPAVWKYWLITKRTLAS